MLYYLHISFVIFIELFHTMHSPLYHSLTHIKSVKFFILKMQILDNKEETTEIEYDKRDFEARVSRFYLTIFQISCLFLWWHRVLLGRLSRILT